MQIRTTTGYVTEVNDEAAKILLAREEHDYEAVEPEPKEESKPAKPSKRRKK